MSLETKFDLGNCGLYLHLVRKPTPSIAMELAILYTEFLSALTGQASYRNKNRGNILLRLQKKKKTLVGNDSFKFVAT
jgi:hypothetical protein